MVWVETTRHAFLRRSLERVAVALESLDHAIERFAAAIVEHRLPVAVEHVRFGHVKTDREDDGLRMEVEPVTGRPFLLAALPPPQGLVIFVWLLVRREADVAIDPLHAVVSPRVDPQPRAQRPEPRAQIDDELFRGLEHVLFEVGSVFVEPVLAAVAPKRAQKSPCPGLARTPLRVASSDRRRYAAPGR